MSIPDEQAPNVTIARLGALLSEWEVEATAAHEARQTGTNRGPVTSLKSLDATLGGFLSPGLHILHGQPGTGKTALALQIAGTCGCPALVVSCEMARLELFRRVTARAAGVYLGRLKSGELTPAVSLAYARTAASQAPDLVLGDATLGYATPKWIQESALVTRGEARHLLVVIDSIHSWADSDPSAGEEYDSLNHHLRQARILAQQLQCPVLAVAERNRAGMKTGGLSAGAGSRKIEYGAESVWDLERQSDDADAFGNVRVQLKMVKNRNGSPGAKVDLLFEGRTQTFKEA